MKITKRFTMATAVLLGASFLTGCAGRTGSLPGLGSIFPKSTVTNVEEDTLLSKDAFETSDALARYQSKAESSPARTAARSSSWLGARSASRSTST